LALFRLSRFDEAKAAIEQTVQQQFDTATSHRTIYLIASVRGEAETMGHQLDWLNQHSSEHLALHLQANTAASAGQLRQARTLSRRAVDVAAQRNLKAQAAIFAVWQMLNEASCGLCQQAKQEAAQALTLSRAGLALTNLPPLPAAAFAVALCGEAGEAQKLADEIERRYPNATLTKAIYLPATHAASELQRGHPD